MDYSEGLWIVTKIKKSNFFSTSLWPQPHLLYVLLLHPIYFSCAFFQVVKWCSQSEGGVAGDEEGSSNHDVKRHAQLVAQLLHIEWTDAKSKLVQEMNEREAKNYENLLGVRHTVGDITFA